MNQRASLAATTLILLAVACTSDNNAPQLVSPSSASHATTVTAPDAAPMWLVIFPSIAITGSFLPSPTASIAPASPASFDRTFHLSSSNPAILSQLPQTVTLPAGFDRINVGLAVPAVTTTTSVIVTASGAGTTMSAVLTLLPPNSPQPAKMIDTIFATPLTVAAGTPSTATITLTNPAPAGGLVVGLGVKLPLTALMPPAVVVPAGTRTVKVPITTFIGFPNSTTSVQISAFAGPSIVANGVNVVTGDVKPPLSLNPVKLNAPIVGGVASVVGGTSLTGTMSLNGPAPAGGAFITLVSTDTTVATVPASLVIPAGGTSANFPIATKTVSAITSSNVGGGFAGGFLVATLRVTPGSATTPPPVTPPPITPPPVTPPSGGTVSAPTLASPAADSRFKPGAAIAFDWSDVANAASYTIQVSDNDKFSSTLVNQTVTTSQLTTSTLPTKTLWWRVRANAASGTSSSFTSARRFEVK
jgi:hypothetical protein